MSYYNDRRRYHRRSIFPSIWEIIEFLLTIATLAVAGVGIWIFLKNPDNPFAPYISPDSVPDLPEFVKIPGVTEERNKEEEEGFGVPSIVYVFIVCIVLAILLKLFGARVRHIIEEKKIMEKIKERIPKNIQDQFTRTTEKVRKYGTNMFKKFSRGDSNNPQEATPNDSQDTNSNDSQNVNPNEPKTI